MEQSGAEAAPRSYFIFQNQTSRYTGNARHVRLIAAFFCDYARISRVATAFVFSRRLTSAARNAFAPNFASSHLQRRIYKCASKAGLQIWKRVYKFGGALIKNSKIFRRRKWRGTGRRPFSLSPLLLFFRVRRFF
ncbi:MAG: hypothetical protein DBX55_01165 [Verrucomicrobia bacterium]|nr:MAG: hypothetical protein DBX55_01165 [Verrucomicrobiota bacterium]